ncbi:MAG: hypothetical protein ACFFBU_08085 [Promethearchaeota archaeon]
MSQTSNGLKLGLVMVLTAIIITAGVLASFSLFVPQHQNPPSGEVDVRVINGDVTINLNFTFLSSISPNQGDSAYQNRFNNWRGTGTYIGVSLATIVELVGGMDSNDVIRVNASDGYYQYYAYYNLYPNTSISELQGNLVLAHSYNGTTPTEWGDGPRTVFLPSDSAYSNDDANSTTHPAWFSGSAGARWVRNVATIEVLHDVYIGGSFHFTVIDGDAEQDVYLLDLALMNNLEGFTGYQNKMSNWPGNGTYQGVPLSAIVELITTIDNDDIVNVTAIDWAQAFAYYNLYPNETVYNYQGDLILAYVFNGTMVTAWADGPMIAFLTPDGTYSNDDASQTTEPTWFFGSAGARWVRNVITIEIIRDNFPP